jgi:eukaryotic-like serine/threonine-protein kinase
MDAERLKRIEEIYHAAMEILPAERDSFLDESCTGDEEMRREVESLLAVQLFSNNIFDTPPDSLAAEMIFEGVKTVDFADTKISHYEIKKLLGRGGMGAVYLAEDTLLERKVAVKFLNPDFSRNADKLHRFIREAKAASALNHPNIMTVHEIGESDGTKYIVTEFIEGKTLREYLSADESISLSEVLTIAVQVTEALAAAHRAGIVHRDIKPENIMIREDGYAKVLDFGLAKLAATGVTATGSEDPTRIQINTSPGMVMGTVSYMSPEQARGKQTDARTDLWSLGVVLYEMITRQLPFAGETMSDTIAAILTKELPPLAQFIADCPAELQRIISRALAKKPDERYQTAGEMMDDLKTLRRGTEISGEIEYLKTVQTGADAQLSTSENEPPRTFDEADKNHPAGNNELPTDEKYLTYSVEVEKVKRRYRKQTIAAVGLLLIGSLAYFGYFYFKPKRLIETAFNRTTFEKIPIQGSVELTEISPDKRYLAYVERKSGDETRRLVLRQMETGAEKEILPMGKSYVRDIKFSPDGNYFYYAFESLTVAVVRVDVFRVPLLGGEPEKVVENIARIFSVSPDGRKITFVRNEASPAESKIVISNLETKEERSLISAKDGEFQSVAFSPDGTKIAAFVSEPGGENTFNLTWIPVEGGELKKVSETVVRYGATFDWLKDGSGLVVAGRLTDQKYGQLYKISFPQGSFTPITTSTSTFSDVSVSQDGGFMVALQTNKSNGVWEFDLASKSARQIIPTTKDELKVEDVTSAGRLLITRTDNRGKDGLLLINADGTDEKFLTLYNGENSGPLQRAAITNDEKYCYYVSDNDVWRINLDGSGKENLTNTPSIKKAFGGVAPDSAYVLFDNAAEPWSIQKLDIKTRKVTPVLEGKDNTFVIFGVARNKNLIAYVKDSVFLVANYDGNSVSEPKNFINITRSTGFVFSPDGNKVYFTPYGDSPDEINTMEMAEKNLVSGKLSKITNFKIEEILNYTISRDGKKLYLVRGNTSDEVVLIRNAE